MMAPYLALVLAGGAGIGLGLFYFGGLWLTVQRLPTCRWPMPLALASFVARTAVALVGFYFVMDGRWERMLACLAGFLLVRLVMIHRLRAEQASHAPRGKELV